MILPMLNRIKESTCANKWFERKQGVQVFVSNIFVNFRSRLRPTFGGCNPHLSQAADRCLQRKNKNFGGGSGFMKRIKIIQNSHHY